MELEISEFILFVKGKIAYEDDLVDENTKLSDYDVDGTVAIFLLEDIENRYQISFDNFEFEQYFHTEAELRTGIMSDNWRDWFRKKEIRKIEKELTVGMLYDFVISNKSK
jgi:hypothetical protein